VDKAKGGRKHSLAEKVVVPMAATLASVATSYVIKKAPEIFRDKVLPKVREKGGFEPLAQDLLQRVKQTVDSVVPADLPIPALGSSDSSSGAGRSASDKRLSKRQLASNRREREQHRRERRGAASR
jgi:hypothetical protein